jgi:hypothetical protein
MHASLGGAEKLVAVNDFEETVKAQIWNSSGAWAGEVWQRTRWMRSPNLLRLDQYGPRDTYVLFFDGGAHSGWEMLPDTRGPNLFKTAGEAIALTGGELSFATDYLNGFDLTMWLADRQPGHVVVSPAPSVVRIIREGSAMDLALDSATGLPWKTNSVSFSDPSRLLAAEMRLEEWDVFDGVRFPVKRANYHSGTRLAEEISQGPIHINSGLKPLDLAAKPPNFAPEIPTRFPLTSSLTVDEHSKGGKLNAGRNHRWIAQEDCSSNFVFLGVVAEGAVGHLQ